MIAVSIASIREWVVTAEYYQITKEQCTGYPFGEYFFTQISGKEILFFLTGTRKTNASAAAQYIIDHFHPEKMLIMGTCAGIDPAYQIGDIIIPYRAVQVDTTVKELDVLIRKELIVDLDLSDLHFPYNTGILGCGDKAVVIYKDYLELKEHGITIADTESASIAYVCKKNDVRCVIIRGISDFPEDQSFEEASNLDNPQIFNYLNNIPPVMKHLFDEYIEQLIKTENNPS